MSRFHDYVGETLAGVGQGAGDITRSAIADVSDSYQEILLADSHISAPDGWTQTMESVSYEMERDQNPSVLETNSAPEITAEPEPEIDIES